jgi:hypothetical protein
MSCLDIFIPASGNYSNLHVCSTGVVLQMHAGIYDYMYLIVRYVFTIPSISYIFCYFNLIYYMPDQQKRQPMKIDTAGIIIYFTVGSKSFINVTDRWYREYIPDNKVHIVIDPSMHL